MSEQTTNRFKEWLLKWKTEPLVCAEGYQWEFEKRGYIAAGRFTPDFITDYPERVEQMTEDFMFVGSDVALAFQFYTHRHKMILLGKEYLTEKTNKTALDIAKRVSQKTGKIFAGGLSCTFAEDAGIEEKDVEAFIEKIFREQLEWNKEAGVEYVVAETLSYAMEGRIAAKLAKEMDLPIVVTFNLYNPEARTLDGVAVEEACVQARECGADVVGVNCGFGPLATIPVVQRVRDAVDADCPVAALPCCFRLPKERPAYMMTIDPHTGCNAYSEDMGAFGCSATEVQEFTLACLKMGVTYLGLCCGNYGALTRRMVETLGRKPPASKFSPHRDQVRPSVVKYASEKAFVGLPPRVGARPIDGES